MLLKPFFKDDLNQTFFVTKSTLLYMHRAWLVLSLLEMYEFIKSEKFKSMQKIKQHFLVISTYPSDLASSLISGTMLRVLWVDGVLNVKLA